jgi:hypothetical protein
VRLRSAESAKALVGSTTHQRLEAEANGLGIGGRAYGILATPAPALDFLCIHPGNSDMRI